MAQKKSNKVKYLIILAILVGFSIIALPVLAVGVFGFTYFNVARPFQIAGHSMEPNFKDGQYYLTDLYHADKDELKVGQVVVYKFPKNPSRYGIGRIIGIPGEEIRIEGGAVSSNGQKLIEDYTNGNKTTGSSFLEDGEDAIVPPNEYFIMGDNRPYSGDSREWGFVPEANIISTIGTCYKGCN